MQGDTKWSIDQAHSAIAFKVRHLMIAHVKGSFKTFDASIYTNGNDFTTAEIDLWIDAASITTGDAKRDEHLKGSDFLDVENHKQITFTASKINKEKVNSEPELWGELTIVGITRSIKLEVTFGGIVMDPWGNEKAGFTLEGKINRRDWGLIWNIPIGTEVLMVSEEIKISCEIELINMGQLALKMELEPIASEEVIL